MFRSVRLDAFDVLHHIMGRGVKKRPIFLTEPHAAMTPCRMRTPANVHTGSFDFMEKIRNEKSVLYGWLVSVVISGQCSLVNKSWNWFRVLEGMGIIQTSRRYYRFPITPFSLAVFYSLWVDTPFQTFRIRSLFFIHSLFGWHFYFYSTYVFSQKRPKRI